MTASLHAIRVRLPCESARDFEQKYAPAIAANGIPVPTGNLRPVGSRVRLTLQLRSGEEVSGEAVVSAHGTGAKPTMIVRYVQLDPESLPLPLGEPRAAAPARTPAPSPELAQMPARTPVPFSLAPPARTPVPPPEVSRVDVRTPAPPADAPARSPVPGRVPLAAIGPARGARPPAPPAPPPPATAAGEDGDVASVLDGIFEFDENAAPAGGADIPSLLEEAPAERERPRAAERTPLPAERPEAAVQDRVPGPPTYADEAPATPRRSAFPVMVGIGAALAVIAGLAAWVALKPGADARPSPRAGAAAARGADVGALVAAADRAMAEGRLAGRDDAALAQLLAARAAAPSDARVLERLHMLANTFEAFAARALERGDASEAAIHLSRAEQADPGRDSLRAKRARLEALAPHPAAGR